MRFVPISCEQRETMLRAVGARDADALFDVVPAEVRLRRALDLPQEMSEQELVAHVEALASRNESGLVSFLGAGCYDHYVPAIVDAVLRRPEFYTAYTPYQPEISQGTLQATYEFQSEICALTGMDVANASMYDGATAFAEAAFMAARVTKRSRVVVSDAVHPEWLDVLRTYASAGTLELEVCPADRGATDLDAVARAASGAAAILVADPAFHGVFEDVGRLAELAHGEGALLVVAANPIILGIVTPPGEAGADIVVGEGQPLGNPMSLGGPGFGFFASRQEHLRQMPGRIVGRTVDVDGRTGYVLTMQTREQHIRRERATSNICSNHALNALAASVYLASVGAAGLAEVARSCVAKAHYLHWRLLETGRFDDPFSRPFGYEFTLRFDGDVAAMQATLLDRGFLAGVDLSRFGAEERGLVLFAVTERRTRQELDAFAEAVNAL